MACWEPTDGNPLFVCELLAAAREEGFTARAESVSALRWIAPGVGRDVGDRWARANGRRRGRARPRGRGAQRRRRGRARGAPRRACRVDRGRHTDAGLALGAAEAAIALVGMANERTAPGALRRAEGLPRSSAGTAANPPVYLPVTLAQYAARSNRAAEARELAQRALAPEPYPPPLDI